MAKKAYLERATTKELLNELLSRSIYASDNRNWNAVMCNRTQHLLGVLPKDLLDYKPEEK